jgi:hypothetical protein
MYYISALENNCALSVVKKRLGDAPWGAGSQAKRFCPWFVNRGAWVAARGSRFLGDGLRPVVGAQFFADWG